MMTVNECYAQMGEDIGEVLSRLGSEALVKRFAIKFLDDECFKNLKEGLEENDGQKAFRAAHTLKGICLNLGFRQLNELSAEITEKLRGYDTQGCEELFAAIETKYNSMIEAISKLATEE